MAEWTESLNVDGKKVCAMDTQTVSSMGSGVVAGSAVLLAAEMVQ